MINFKIYVCRIGSNFTAAHCVYPKQTRQQRFPRDVRTLLGAYDLSEPYESGRYLPATDEIRVHPRWNPDTDNFDGDIAILIMDDEIPFSNSIRPICLMPRNSDLMSIRTGTVVGYGVTSEYASEPESIPRVINIPIHNNEYCIRKFHEIADISSPRTFCAGSGDGSGICMGDSGSGLFVKYDDTEYIRGIVSASFFKPGRTCDVNKYAVFTNINDYYDWIVSGDSDLQAFNNDKSSFNSR